MNIYLRGQQNIKGSDSTIDPSYFQGLNIFNMSNREIQIIYRKGALKEVGGQVLVNDEIWDIVSYNSDYTVATLLKREPISEMVYDAREAMFSFPNGLEAGDYYFVIGDQPWYKEDIGKSITFTLTKNIPENGTIVIETKYNETMDGTILASFENTTTTFQIERALLSYGNNGINLGVLTNAGNFDNNINSIQKGYLGSNTWSESAQRQWLNSNAVKGLVWNPTNKFDRPPTWVYKIRGFMYGLDEDFLSVVLPTTYITYRNSITDGGGYDTCTDKFYLPSKSEIFGINDDLNINEGQRFSYYNNSLGVDRIKYSSNQPCSWRLRTPTFDNAGGVYHVDLNGELNYYTANTPMKVAPVCRVDLTQMETNNWLKTNFLNLGIFNIS